MVTLLLINAEKKKWAEIIVISNRNWKFPEGWQKVGNNWLPGKKYKEITTRGCTGLVNAFNKLNPVASCPQAQKSP